MKPDSPKKVHVIDMTGAKRFKSKKRTRGLPSSAGEQLSAEDALKQYYDKMYSLELKLKNDLEQ